MNEDLVNVLDTSAFFVNLPLNGRLMTVSRVVEELRDIKGKARFMVLESYGLMVQNPSPDAIRSVESTAELSGDLTVLSDTDISLLALALEVKGMVWTDDFAIQNTATVLGIPISPILQRRAAAWKWRFKCMGCERFSDEMPQDGICQICGTVVRRVKGRE